MLPDPDNAPAELCKLLVDHFVSSTVPCDLVWPVLRVSRRNPPMSWACVPETAVNHDGQFRPWKGHIDSNRANVRQLHQIVNAKSQALGIEAGPNRPLKARVAAPGLLPLGR